MPSVFDDLVGQEPAVAILQGAVAAARTGEETQEMTHAWIFTGPPGSGRSSAAVAFAQALVCPQGGCGTCNECRSTKSSAHPDVEIISTEGLSIKIDEIRELLPNISLIHSETRPGDIRNSDNGSPRLRELFPEAQPTTLHEGILRTKEWLSSMREEIEVHPLLVSDD